MAAYDWCVPGQWTLARYRCDACGFDGWADLPFNLGVLSPCFVDTRSGGVSRPSGPEWYAALTRAAWRGRGRQPARLRRIVHRPVRRAVLVNALGNCWGDALSTLAKLNALGPAALADVVVLTTANMAPHVSAGVGELWLVDGPHAATAFWNEELADAVRLEVSRFETCDVPTIFQLPRLTQAEVAALSGIHPFDRTRWDERLEAGPTVTFLWRDDRCWAPEPRRLRQVLGKWHSVRGAGRAARTLQRAHDRMAPGRQLRRVTSLARQLRAALPKLDFAVCGQGSYGSFPDWIRDLRRPHADADANTAWCERAARSHLLIGVLGSQMMLPSGHAGGVIDLIPSGYLRNVLTDWMITTDDVREALFLYRPLPVSTDAASVAETAIAMLVNYTCARSSLHASHYAPLEAAAVDALTRMQNERVRILGAAASPRGAHLIGP
jgi:hypothetical protein